MKTIGKAKGRELHNGDINFSQYLPSVKSGNLMEELQWSQFSFCSEGKTALPARLGVTVHATACRPLQ
jgi:hypothetical protein